jgi:hypothetical protein
MEIVIAIVVGLVIVGGLSALISQVPDNVIFWGIMLVGFSVIGFVVGAFVLDWFDIINYGLELGNA